MSWSSPKKKEFFFCNVYFDRRNFFQHLCFISIYSVFNKLSQYVFTYQKNITSYSSKAYSVSLMYIYFYYLFIIQKNVIEINPLFISLWNISKSNIPVQGVMQQIFFGGGSKMRCDHDFDQVLIKSNWKSEYIQIILS